MALFTFFAGACSTGIHLDATDAGTEGDVPSMDAGFMMNDGGPIDAGVDGRVDADESVCGFRFERNAQVYEQVWSRSATDVWLVERQRGILHWNGAELEERPLPPEAGNGGVVHLTGAPGGEPWVVAKRTTGLFSEMLLYHWHDDGWQSLPLPDELELAHMQLQVLASDNVWALGFTSNSLVSRVLLHFDGRRWQVVEVPVDERYQFARYTNLKLSAFDADRVMLQMRSSSSRQDAAYDFLVGDAMGVRELELPEDFLHPRPVRRWPLWHRETDAGEFWMNASGEIWNGTEWERTLQQPLGVPWRWGVLEVAEYAGSIWVVLTQGVFEIDPANANRWTFHGPPAGNGPESIHAVVVSEAGPPFVAGPLGVYYWDGARWRSQLVTEPPLFDGHDGIGAWGTSASDYWLWSHYPVGTGVRTAVHLHDGIIERPMGPLECRGRRYVQDVANLGSDLVGITCLGLQRIRDGVADDLLIPHARVDGRVLEASLWGHGDTVYAFMNNAVHRVDGEGAVVEQADVFDEPFQSSSIEGDDAGNVYLLGRTSRGENVLFARRDSSWGWMPPLDRSDSEDMSPDHFDPFGLHVEESGRVWVVSLSRHEGTRVWAINDGVLTSEDIPNPTRRGGHAFIDGRDGRVWMINSDRAIWRHVDGEWQVDERCMDAPELQNRRFHGLWFPPDGPPKIFLDGGDILVWQGDPE